MRIFKGVIRRWYAPATSAKLSGQNAKSPIPLNRPSLFPPPSPSSALCLFLFICTLSGDPAPSRISVGAAPSLPPLFLFLFFLRYFSGFVDLIFSPICTNSLCPQPTFFLYFPSTFLSICRPYFLPFPPCPAPALILSIKLVFPLSIVYFLCLPVFVPCSFFGPSLSRSLSLLFVSCLSFSYLIISLILSISLVVSLSRFYFLLPSSVLLFGPSLSPILFPSLTLHLSLPHFLSLRISHLHSASRSLFPRA